MEYSISLALYDFLPVAFTAVGLYWVERMVAFISSGLGRTAALGALLVVAGGLAKAVWKLVMSLSGGTLDIRWLDNSLFTLMAPGFLLLAASVWGVTRVVRGLSPEPVRLLGPLSVTLVLGAAVVMRVLRPESPAWSRILLTAMVVAALAMNVMFVIFAIRERLAPAAALMIVNLMGTLALNALARLPEQTIPLQWVEQTLNTASWLAFALATGMIYAHTRARFGVDDGREKLPAVAMGRVT